MIAKIYLFYRKCNGDLRAMSSYLEKLDISAVKIVNVHPDNQAKYNLPTVMAVIDPKKGAPIAPRLTPIFPCLSFQNLNSRCSRRASNILNSAPELFSRITISFNHLIEKDQNWWTLSFPLSELACLFSGKSSSVFRR